jgi:hypothetical protein
LEWTSNLVESKELWGSQTWLNPRSTGWPMTWLVPRSTGVAGDLVDSKEHWDRPVTWLIQRALGWTNGLVESKEY